MVLCKSSSLSTKCTDYLGFGSIFPGPCALTLLCIYPMTLTQTQVGI